MPHIKHHVDCDVNPVFNNDINVLFSIVGVKHDEPIDRALRWARALGMNQSRFAEAIGATPAVITNWKARGMPSDHYATVAAVTRHTIDELVTGRPQTPPNRQFSEDTLRFAEQYEKLNSLERYRLHLIVQAIGYERRRPGRPPWKGPERRGVPP